MDTERVRFCTGPEVNFDFFYIPPPLGHLRWWRHRYLLREFHGKYRISRGKKLALITSGAIGLQKTKPDSDPIKKRQTRWPDFSSNFSAAPRGDPIICNRGRALEAETLISTNKTTAVLIFQHRLKLKDMQRNDRQIIHIISILEIEISTHSTL